MLQNKQLNIYITTHKTYVNPFNGNKKNLTNENNEMLFLAIC